MGEITWSWPLLPACKCKPMGIMKFEGGIELFNKGAHIPIIAFIGDAKDKDRSVWAYQKRDDGAKPRKWDKESRNKRDGWNKAGGWKDGWNY